MATATLSDRIWMLLREAARTRRERATVREEAQMREGLRVSFRDQERLLLAALDNMRELIDPEFMEQEGIHSVDVTPIWREIAEETQPEMEDIIQEGSTGAFARGSQHLVRDLAVDVALDLGHPRAVRFLEERGARLVRNINATTRRDVQRILVNAARQGKSYGTVRQELRAKFAQFHTPQPQLHIRDRAELIAVQEAGEAYEQGNLETAEELRDLGITLEKSSLTAEDTRVDDLCQTNERQGWIPLESQYQSGAIRPPFHVACRCTQLVRRAS